MYVFALVWLISFLIWWPVAMPADRLIYWAPKMNALVTGSPEFATMLFDMAVALVTAPLMYVFVLSGTPVVIVTAAAMSAILHIWPKPRSKWKSALAGSVAALLIAPIATLYAINMTVDDSGPTDPSTIVVRGADVEHLWYVYLLSAYPLASAVGGYCMGKPLLGDSTAN